MTDKKPARKPLTGKNREQHLDPSRKNLSEAEWVRGVLRDGDDRGALYAIIMLSAAGSVLPELLDFFDGDARKTLDFVTRFAGQTVRFPTRSDVLAMTRRVSVVRDVVVGNQTFAETAEKHGLSAQGAKRVYQSGIEILVEQGVLLDSRSFAAEEARAEGQA